ncbi:hypothetical protein FOPG_18858 [Fusarium oxysporum f. sp. conglutinans race 2 54008]|uniref:Uncharacterized protein n=1 Tax=Fusarium oxysporum f. sp. conglutinans race 2 54008 TaxID=1089457 RepID=X0GMQ8_FUSOX|nr:hypothetical protein FOPG_18858 [Fusarium oxysporum f. sp. conglutinans race 2 54008]
MTNEERDISRLARLDTYGGQYSKKSALNAERSRLEAEIAHLSYLLVAHRDCCGTSQGCTHSMHLGPPQNTSIAEYFRGSMAGKFSTRPSDPFLALKSGAGPWRLPRLLRLAGYPT